MFKDISKSNISTRSWVAYKQWVVEEDIIPPLYGTPFSNTIDTQLELNSNGISKGGLYHSIKHLYYDNPTLGSVMNDTGFRKNYNSTDERVLSNTIAVISIPQYMYGNGIQRNSVELEFLDNVLIDDGYSNIVNDVGEVYGNVFYGVGIIVITKSVIDEVTLNTYQLKFKSTVVINETEVLLNINETEFNISQNPTAISGSEILYDGIVSAIDQNISGGFFDVYRYQELDSTGSYLEPYITTIGLFDSELQMVAVAKLAIPIKKSYGDSLNFLLKFDT